MDWQTISIGALGAINFLLGVLSKIIWDTLSTLRQDMAKLAETVNEDRKQSSETFMRRDDFAAAIIDLKATMNRGFDQLAAQLSSKADKQ
jgi:hypothetical protein